MQLTQTYWWIWEPKNVFSWTVSISIMSSVLHWSLGGVGTTSSRTFLLVKWPQLELLLTYNECKQKTSQWFIHFIANGSLMEELRTVTTAWHLLIMLVTSLVTHSCEMTSHPSSSPPRELCWSFNGEGTANTSLLWGLTFTVVPGLTPNNNYFHWTLYVVRISY